MASEYNMVSYIVSWIRKVKTKEIKETMGFW